MTNIIKGLAKRIDNVPVELLDDAIKVFVDIAERNGGKMMGGRYQLTAKPDKLRVRGEQASVLMKGVPSGFWVWRETGTGEHTIRPKRRKKRGWKPGPLGLPGHPVWGPVIHPGTAGQLRWTKTVDQAAKAIDDLVERGVEKAVR
jgi:hypothetical protein